MRIQQILQNLERIAPERYTFEFDRVGLQVGDPEMDVRRAIVSLDRSLGAVQFAIDRQAQFLLAHHPLIFTPLNSVVANGHVGRTVLKLAENRIAFAAAHTNWDSAMGGINDALATKLGLANLKPFGYAAPVAKLKLVTFVPETHVDGLVDALSEAGAGVIGDYTRCAFRSDGLGTFEPGEGSQPFIGIPGGRQQAPEARIEMILPESAMRRVRSALLRVHPYETPAFDFVQLAGDPEQAAGRVGEIAERTTLRQFAEFVSSVLSTRCEVWGDGAKLVRKVAIVGGAADGEWMAAQRAGADVFVTGEVKQHVGLEASESGLPILAAGHFATEHPGAAVLADRMRDLVPEVEWIVFEPAPGLHGRPFIA